MSLIKVVVQAIFVCALGCSCALPHLQAAAIDLNSPVPPIVQKGIALYASAGPVQALETWRQGGLLDGSRNDVQQTETFREMVRPLRNYLSYELVATKEICRTSKIVYLAMNFERGLLYASFLVYHRADKEWIVQNMDFNTKPDVIMPWLAFEGVR